MDLQELLNKFEGVKEVKTKQGSYMALCPAHNDKNPSLSITEKEGKRLVHCFNGCKTEDILQAVGLQEKDLYCNQINQIKTGRKLGDYRLNRNANTTDWLQKNSTAFYIYTNTDGKPVMAARRYKEPNKEKSFRSYRYLGCDKWESGLGDIKRVLYNLPDVKRAIEEDQYIFFPEGEKDCLTLKDMGLYATTNANGAEGWKQEYTEQLRDARVILLPDNDMAGFKHVVQVYYSLQGIAKEIKILNLPGLQEKEDVTDWIKLHGGNREKLLYHIENSLITIEEIKARYNMAGEQGTKRNSENQRKGLNDYLLQDNDLNIPDYWLIDDILSPFTLNTIYSAAGAGKSLFVLMLSCYLLENKKVDTVIYLDKDNSKKTLQNRNLLQIRNKYGANKFKYIPACNMDYNIINVLLEDLKYRKYGHCLVIIDTVRNFLKGDANSDKDSIAFMDIMKQIREYDNTVILLHHVNKMKQIKNNTSIVDYSDVVYKLEANKDKNNNKLFLNISLGDCPKDRIGVKEEFTGVLDYKDYTLLLQDQGLNPIDLDFINYVRNLLQAHGEMNQSQIWDNVKRELDITFKGEFHKKLESYKGVIWESKKSKYCNTCMYSLLPEEKFKTILSFTLFNNNINNNNKINNNRQLDNPITTPFIECMGNRQLDNPITTPFVEETIENTRLSNVDNTESIKNGEISGLSNFFQGKSAESGTMQGCLGCHGNIRQPENSISDHEKIICANCKYATLDQFNTFATCRITGNQDFNKYFEHTCRDFQEISSFTSNVSQVGNEEEFVTPF